MTPLSRLAAKPYRQWAPHAIGVVLAVLAGVRHMVLMTSATNDNFLHMTLAQQLLAGDWPVRDFFDGGWVLQYTLSAVAQLVVGNRLLAEAVIVGAAWACSTYLVFRVVRSVSGSTAAATIAGVLLVLAAARGYSYPKAVIYAVAATLWWEYIRRPTLARATGFGIWAAVAFYWRPDHGLYVAIAIVLAAWVAHGFSRAWVTRCAAAGGAMLALVAPLMVYVNLAFGLPAYVQTGLAAARTEHTTQGPHAWPVLRFWEDLVAFEPADIYAPVVTIRWTSASSIDDRNEILARYGLTTVTAEDDSARVRLSERAIAELRALVNEPAVEDTAGIDRSTGTLPPSSWPDWQQRAFRQSWRRIQVLPSLQDQARASEFIVALFYALPILMLAGSASMSRHLGAGISARAFAAFAGFAFLVDLAMLRVPFPARVFDAVVLSAIVFGCCVTWLWRAGSHHVGRVLLRTAAVVLAAVLITNVAHAGQLFASVKVIAAGPFAELNALPPLAHYVDRSARFTLQLAAYARECVPPSDRLLVLWFEPEIYYYSERLMAQRHLVFAPTWATLAHEQKTTLDKIRRFSPPLALARQSALVEYARATYPGVVAYVESEYTVAATIDNADEQYLIFVRKDRQPIRGFGQQNWPCFVRDGSPWARVGFARD